MKERTKNAFKKLADLTCKKCEECPKHAEKTGEPMDPYRCCDKMFCQIVEMGLRWKGVPLEKPNVGGIPFMGEKGCVVSPELRPYCTGFVCVPHFKDREFRREYDRTIAEINEDKDGPKMPEIMKALTGQRKRETE